jgi:hypothetical protein
VRLEEYLKNCSWHILNGTRLKGHGNNRCWPALCFINW